MQLASFFTHFYESPVDQLLISMIFGRTEGFSQGLRLKFNVIGMLHVVCASGFNVSLVVTVVKQLIDSFLPRKLLAVFLTIVVWFYFLLANGGLALTRAALMSTVRLLIGLVGFKQYGPMRALVFSSLIIAVFSLENLSSVSFQLTVAATLGMLLFPRVEIKLKTHDASLAHKIFFYIKRLILESFLTSLAAQLLVLPLILFYFQELSWVGFLSNSLILWLVPWITCLGLAWATAAFFLSFLPGGGNLMQVASWPVAWLTKLFLYLVNAFSHLGQPVEVLNFSYKKLVVYYVILYLMYKLYKYLLKIKQLTLLGGNIELTR